MRNLHFALAMVAGIFGHSSAVQASPSARIIYSRGAGAEGCADEGALRRAVAARVGYDPFFAWANMSVVVEIDRRGGHLSGRVRLLDEHGISGGVRELTSEELDCEELFHAVALAISIAIDPHSLVAPAPPAPAPATATDVSPTPATPQIRPPPEESPRARATALPSKQATIDVGVGVASSIGTAPAPALGGLAFVALTGRRASLELDLRFDAPTSKNVAGGGRVGSWLLAGALAPCVRFTPAFGCGLGMVGRLAAWGSNVPAESSDAAVFGALGGRIGVEVPFGGGFVARFRTDLLMNVYRATFRLNGVDAWTAPLISASTGLDLMVRIP